MLAELEAPAQPHPGPLPPAELPALEPVPLVPASVAEAPTLPPLPARAPPPPPAPFVARPVGGGSQLPLLQAAPPGQRATLHASTHTPARQTWPVAQVIDWQPLSTQ